MIKRIVIIDDSLFLIKQLTAFFEAVMGYQVVAAGADGTQALELYRKHKPDLMTLDITMPNKDGVEALAEILAADPNARVMIISAVRGPEMTRCLALGARGYMAKPLLFSDDQFVREFRESLEDIFGP